MLQVAKEIEDKDFFIRLSTMPNPEDAFANDVFYHQSCWMYKLIHIQKTAMSRRYLNCDVKTKKSIENLPPTKDVLHCKILRSHHITYLFKSTQLPVVYIPNATLYGWYYDKGKLLPVTWINKLPASTNMISLTICSCK